MADSDDEVPTLDLEDEETNKGGKRGSAEKEKSSEIPNFKGKVPEAERDDSKGSLQIKWDADELQNPSDDDDEDEYEDEETPEGEVGEEFAKARREALRERREKRLAEEEGSDDEEVPEDEELWNFPIDKDKWDEDDINEEWADAWGGDEKTGFDPDLVDDWEEVRRLWQQGEGPPARPYYVPYRKHYPLIPEDHPDIQTPKDVVHELERIEEFLVWASYIFKDGSSYEGTVFDDLAHGKGVFTTAFDLCRYEGEWFQNAMEGHGVLEVDIPVVEPPPGSEAAKKLRAQGNVLSTDSWDEEDKEWLNMEAEEKMEMGEEAIDTNPFEDDEAWVKRFGEKPEKGNYRYSGQWKHSRMHGCGLYEVNGRPIYGQFYFGELLPDKGDCDENQVAIHSGLAEIAAAKARMFINKPDGMVREARGPYTDPSHPYMYEEEDLWMAPGFINAFYEVPEPWKRYVEEVDEEQEMWLNSFIKSPFRIPMPAELEYQWVDEDEFVLLSNRDSNPMHQYPENLDPEVEGEILLHTPTGNLINWAEDPEGNLRFFIQPLQEDGEIRPETVIPLPLGFDEFMGIVDEKGNVLDESRRGLPVEEREKLEEEDRKRERREKFQAKIQEMRNEAKEKIKEQETEFYIRELEKKVEDLLLEESFRAELEAVDEEGQDREAEAEDVAQEAKHEKSDTGDEESDTKGFSEDEFPEEEEKPEDGQDSNGGSDDGGQDDEGGEDEDEDEDDKKPRSFGTVAMVLPEEKNIKSNPSQESSQQSFPTIFASLSLVPQMAVKRVLESSISTARRAWSSQFGAHVGGAPTGLQEMESSQVLTGMQHGVKEPGSALNSPPSKVVRVQNFAIRKKSSISCLRLHHSSGPKSPAPARSQHRCIPGSECLLLALKPHQSSPTRSWRAIKSRHNENRRLSKLHSQPPNLLWVLPDMEVLSMALPVQIL